MSLQRDIGFRNPLTRRVRRHSALATLFRAPSSPEPISPMDTQQQTFAGPDTPPGIVQATWGGIASAVTLPEIQTTAQTESRTTNNHPEPLIRDVAAGIAVEDRRSINPPIPDQPARPSGVTHSPVPGSMPPLPNPAIPAGAATGSPARTPEVDSESGMADTVWRRLQTIFKRHQNPPNASLSDEKPAPVPDSEHTVSYQEEIPSIPHNATVTTGENAEQIVTANQSLTAHRTQRSPGATAKIQRFPKMNEEPVTQQLSSAPIIQTRGDRDGSGPLLSEPVPIPGDPGITEIVASTPADFGTRTPDHIGTPVSEPPEPEHSLSRSGIVGNLHTVEKDSSAPLAESNVTAPVRGQDHLAENLDPQVPTSSEPMDQTSGQESTHITPTGTSHPGEHTATHAVIPSPPTSHIQRVTEPVNSQDTPSKLPEIVRDALLPGRQRKVETGYSPMGTIPEHTFGEQQPVPLQEVWQVEQLAPRTTAPGTVRTQGFIHQNERAHDTTIQESISRVLNNVAAGKPTSSSIEVVAPRFPRPVSMHGSGRVQRASMTDDAAQGQNPQRIAVRTQEGRLPVRDGVVDTPIGPLPADLWTLIDEPVPSTVRRQSDLERGANSYFPDPPGSMRAMPHTHTPTQNTAEAAAVSPVSSDTGGRNDSWRESETETPTLAHGPAHSAVTPVPAPALQQPSFIQRVAESPGSDTQTSGVEQSQTTSPEASDTGQEQAQSQEENNVNIDELAQKVYGEVKRKLTVEWERLRTRF